MKYLKSNNRLVVDTHILVEACGQLESLQPRGLEQDLIFEILDRCPKIVLNPNQLDEYRTHVRRKGYSEIGRRKSVRLNTDPLLRRLDESRKLLNLTKTKMKGLEPKLINLLTGNLSDDRHLYQTAISTDKLLITNDRSQLELRERLRKDFKIYIISLKDLLYDELLMRKG
jgi:hypothetical protein